MQKYNVMFLIKVQSKSQLPKDLFASLTTLECQDLSKFTISKGNIDALIVEADCIVSEEDKSYLVNLEVNENIPVLYYFQEKLKDKYINYRSWKIIQSDYTDREINLSIEAAIYKIEIDKEIADYCYQIESSKGKIEKQASAMALMVDKLSILQMQEKRLSDSKSQFLKLIMYQLSTGMNSILGFTQILQMNELKGDIGEAVDEIRFASECLLNQMQNILNMSYYENKGLNFSFSEFDISLALKSLVAIFRKQSANIGLRVEVVEEGLNGYWLGSVEALHLLLFNVISFSIYCSSKPGDLVILMKIKQTKENSILCCSVKRQVGENPEGVKNAFQQIDGLSPIAPYEMYKKEEASLIISEVVLKTLGGKLSHEFENEELTLTFQMPIVFKRANLNDKSEKKEWAVLFVDDNVLFRQIGFEVLTEMNCLVDSAENGLVAIEKLKSNKYDLVLMDCVMPEMDGIEATKRIRLGEAGIRNKDIAIVALTASALNEDREICIKAGMSDFLAKPFRADSVNAMLEKWVRK